ncbi:hypothetical protein E1297_12170 [Roseibium sp. RKSG952]|nr:hypothetical protein [Roseibium sp. RKSG952]
MLEDRVPITTERSFNVEWGTFEASAPVTLALELRDFMENETGLEYIGSRRQQLGDGGAIAQFKDAATGELIAVTSEEWRCKVVQRAPLDEACEFESSPEVDQGACRQETAQVPEGWNQPGFDDSAWPVATLYSSSDVQPKRGYHQVEWDPSASFIWGPDLKKDNIVLCRLTIGG